MAAQGEGSVAQADGDRLAAGGAGRNDADGLARYEADFGQTDYQIVVLNGVRPTYVEHSSPLVNRKLIQAQRAAPLAHGRSRQSRCCHPNIPPR